MKKFVCPVCGYVYEGESIPADFVCPVCKVPGSKFKEMDMAAPLAAEHVFGVGMNLDAVDNAEDKQYIIDQLKANFAGECSEVGMYLCMARVAAREGYPEIALYWEKAAFEEAEHAAKFAELLGSELEPNMTASTEKNLAWRVECEYGATAGTFELAKMAKKYNLDAIHDTVHEM
ncbi:MAG: NADH peroxidase, partial [Clostridia bacterium]|nr:NADH peroxidase [Clostridia bacterium]